MTYIQDLLWLDSKIKALADGMTELMEFAIGDRTGAVIKKEDFKKIQKFSAALLKKFSAVDAKAANLIQNFSDRKDTRVEQIKGIAEIINSAYTMIYSFKGMVTEYYIADPYIESLYEDEFYKEIDHLDQTRNTISSILRPKHK